MARTALADAGVEDFGEDFVSVGHFDGVVADELDWFAEATDESYGLGFGDLVSRHSRRSMRLLALVVSCMCFAWSKKWHMLAEERLRYLYLHVGATVNTLT